MSNHHNEKALSRSAGYRTTMSAMDSKTRSPHHSTAAPQAYGKSVEGYGSNEKVVGYCGGNKSS